MNEFSVQIEDHFGGEIRVWPGDPVSEGPCPWGETKDRHPVPWHLEVREFPGQAIPIHSEVVWRGPSDDLYSSKKGMSQGERMMERGRRILCDRWTVHLGLDGQPAIWDVRVYGNPISLPNFMYVADPRAPTKFAAELAVRTQMEGKVGPEVAWSNKIHVVVQGVRDDLTGPREAWEVGSFMVAKIDEHMKREARTFAQKILDRKLIEVDRRVKWKHRLRTLVSGVLGVFVFAGLAVAMWMGAVALLDALRAGGWVP